MSEHANQVLQNCRPFGPAIHFAFTKTWYQKKFLKKLHHPGLPQNFWDNIPWLFYNTCRVHVIFFTWPFPIWVKIPWLFQKIQKVSKFEKLPDFSMTMANLSLNECLKSSLNQTGSKWTRSFKVSFYVFVAEPVNSIPSCKNYRVFIWMSNR